MPVPGDQSFYQKKKEHELESGVPTSVDLENNSNQKKYTVNQPSKKGFVISKPLCALMAIGALLLAILVGIIVFFLVPRYCNGEKPPEALTKTQSQQLNNNPNNIVRSKADENLNADENKAEQIADERLPRSIEPTHYRIRILPDFEYLNTSGSVTMNLKILEDTNEVIFHLRNISVEDHSVSIRSTKPDSSPLEIIHQDYLDGEKYRIQVNGYMKKDEEFQLYLDYNGELSGHLQGFYESNYYDAKGQKRTIASTQFSPTDARQAFPCYDEPSFKATFSIVLGRPHNMTTLSNMPLVNSTPFSINTETWYWDEYLETPKMSTYLVAFIVSDLVQAPSSDTRINFWARKNMVPQTNYAAEIAPKLLNYYEKYFDISFPLKKIDIVALPAFGYHAMENWGLITFRESSLLYDPNSAANSKKSEIATILAHEMAHQWFGNLVTPTYWNDLWLKEGFANYMEYLGVNYAEPMWSFLEEFAAVQTQEAMMADALESSRAISVDEVRNTREIRGLFDSISYEKGAAIIKMMNHFLGELTFKEGLINFLKQYQFGNANRQDLFSALTDEAHKNGVLKPDESVTTIMDTWAARPGFPVINAVANYEQGKLTISQKRFYFREKDEKSSWWVPLSFTMEINGTANYMDTTPQFWLRGEYEIEKDIENLTDANWYLLNLQQTGYFIVNYDQRNWEQLAENIMELPPSVRAQLISDSMDLARANLLNYNIPLTMIAKMAILDSEIMFIPTLISMDKLEFLSDILSATPAFGLFEDYHRSIFQDTYRTVKPAGIIDDYRTRMIQKTVLSWSCRTPESRCAHTAKTMFREWIVKGLSVDNNLRPIVYCTAIREGSEIEWDFAYKKFLETSSPTEKNIILDALGCTRLRWLLSRYVDKILDDPSIGIQDADRLFNSVANNKYGTQIAFDFLRKNWDAIIAHHGDGFNIVTKMVTTLGTQMNTEFQLSELIRFRESIKTNLSTTARAFEIAIESVKSNVEWMEKNYAQVEQWFRKNSDIRTRIVEQSKREQYLRRNRLGPRA